MILAWVLYSLAFVAPEQKWHLQKTKQCIFSSIGQDNSDIGFPENISNAE
jgi:hypothetical protein